MNSLKVLVISYDFFPDDSPNTYRWKNVLDVWAKQGVKVFVVSAQKPGLNNFEIANGIAIYRTGRSLFERVKSRILKTIRIKEGASPADKKAVAGKGLVRKIYDQTWKKIYWPDFAFLWYAPALRKAQELINQEGIDKVITVSWPFTAHVVGSRLKSVNDITWLADTIDPFYLSKAVNNVFLDSNLNYRYEYKILKTADKVSVLTSKLKAKYESLFPLIKGRVFVNHNIYIPGATPPFSEKESHGVLKLVFVGTLNPITRPPQNLLNLVETFTNRYPHLKLVLHIYGNVEQCSEIFRNYVRLIGHVVIIHEMVSRDKIQQILADADILVNVGNTNPYQEPSKMIEYMYMLKPILNVCSIPEDSSKEALERYPLKLNVFPDDLGDNAKLEGIVKFLKSEEVAGRKAVNNILSDYMLKEVEKRYFKLLWPH